MTEFLERQADLEYLDRVEVEFRVQAAPDGGSLSKALLLNSRLMLECMLAGINPEDEANAPQVDARGGQPVHREDLELAKFAEG